MRVFIWLICMMPCDLLFTFIAVYSFVRKAPMWFWAGTSVKESEITDVKAYNKANGKMWLSFSSVFWGSTAAGIFDIKLGAVFLVCGCAVGIPAIILSYSRIYGRFKVK